MLNGISTFLERRQWYYLTHSRKDKKVYAFPESISLKVNLIARLEFELAYYDVVVQHVNHNTTETLPLGMGLVWFGFIAYQPL